MSVAYTPAPPDQEQVQLRIMDEHVTLTRWTSYEFASDYLTPASAFHFTVADGDLPKNERRALKMGAHVRLTINGVALCDGHIDTVEVSSSRGSGTQWNIGGRERLGLAVDAVADPTLQFKESTSLADVLKALYAPFGWLADEHFAIDNAANRAAKKDLRGTPMTKGGKRKGPKPLKNFVMHQLKPHNHEGVHDFAKRITERHGLWIRCSEDGDVLIVDTPNFDQEPSYQLRRGDHDAGNVLEGRVRFDFTTQPACIFADGFSGGGEFGRGRLKAYAVNPYFGTDEEGFILPEVLAAIAKHPTAEQVVIVTQPFTRRSVNIPPRIVYLHDDESRTQTQLNNFLRREMSMMMRKAATASYTVEGHGQMANEKFVPFLVDTVVEVLDDVADLHERMWISGVNYSKSRQGGTSTRLEMMRLGALPLAEEPPPEKKGKTVTKLNAIDVNANLEHIVFGNKLERWLHKRTR